jgi:pimeloyl-ACP methyl ester carboxylesterase
VNHALIAGSTLTYIKKSGHFPWIEQPDDFRSAIAELLAKLSIDGAP